MVQKEDTLTLMDQSCPVCANNDAPRLGCVRQSLTYTHTLNTPLSSVGCTFEVNCWPGNGSRCS